MRWRGMWLFVVLTRMLCERGLKERSFSAGDGVTQANISTCCRRKARGNRIGESIEGTARQMAVDVGG